MVPTWVGKMVSWLQTQPRRTLILNQAALVWTSLQEGIKLRTKVSAFWYSIPLGNQGRSQLYPATKNQCLGSCEHRSSCVFKVSLSSAAGPPTPNPTEGVTAPAGVWCHNPRAGQAGGTAAGLGAMHPFLMGTCRSYPVSMCPGSCCLKAFWENLGRIGSFGLIFGQLDTTKNHLGIGNLELACEHFLNK